MNRRSIPNAALLIATAMALALTSCDSPESVDPQSSENPSLSSSAPSDQPTVKNPTDNNSDPPSKDSQSKDNLSDRITENTGIVKGQIYLEAIMRAQQVEKLAKGSFASDFEELGIGPLPNTEEYQFALIPTAQNMAAATATAQQEDLFSYIGTVFNVDADSSVMGICKSEQPSKTPPELPTLSGSTVVCAPESSLVAPVTSTGTPD